MSAVKFFDIDLTGVKPPTTNEKIPSRGGSLKIFTLADILNWVIVGMLGVYPHNRGSGRVSKKTSTSAFNGVDPDILSECTFGDYEGSMCLNNWHSRLHGFLRRFIDGDMTKKELSTKICCRVQNDFISGYIGMGKSDPHMSKDKMQNPDLTYGSIWEQISHRFSEGCIKAIGNSKWTVVSALMYSLRYLEWEDWTWPNIYSQRVDVAKDANKPAGTLTLEQDELDNFVQAVRYWYDLMAEMDSQKGPMNINKIKKSAGFFGYVCADRMLAEPKMSQNCKVSARQVLKHAIQIAAICPDLCRGNRDLIVSHTATLDGHLRGKQRQRLRKRVA